MNSKPKKIDLSPVIGEFTTGVMVGHFTLGFNFGDVVFSIMSAVNLYRAGKVFAHWEEGIWPDPGFYEIMNTKIIRCDWAEPKGLSNDMIIIEFENGIEMHLEECPGYESIHIYSLGEYPDIVI